MALEHVHEEVRHAGHVGDAAQLRRVEAGRRSVLRLAVTGQLLPQDASDECADVLLKRIAEERARAGAERAKKRTVRKLRTGPTPKTEEAPA